MHWLGNLVVYFGRLLVDFGRWVEMVCNFVVHSRLGLELMEMLGKYLMWGICWSFQWKN